MIPVDTGVDTERRIQPFRRQLPGNHAMVTIALSANLGIRTGELLAASTIIVAI
jgi:hypothetical protein